MSTFCLSSLILPARCCICGARGARAALDLCEVCLDALPRSADRSCPAGLDAAVAETLQSVTKVRGSVKLVAPGSLPNDGKVIADERPVGA